MNRSARIVLTNGACHGAWCWSLVTPHLSKLGYAVTPLELEGLGGLRGASPAARWQRPHDVQRFATEPSLVANVSLDSAVRRFLDELNMVTNG